MASSGYKADARSPRIPKKYYFSFFKKLELWKNFTDQLAAFSV